MKSSKPGSKNIFNSRSLAEIESWNITTNPDWWGARSRCLSYILSPDSDGIWCILCLISKSPLSNVKSSVNLLIQRRRLINGSERGIIVLCQLALMFCCFLPVKGVVDHKRKWMARINWRLRWKLTLTIERGKPSTGGCLPQGKLVFVLCSLSGNDGKAAGICSNLALYRDEYIVLLIIWLTDTWRGWISEVAETD